MKFKIGDKVKCIDNYGGRLSLTLNKEYIVNNIFGIILQVKNDVGYLDGYPVEKFELVEDYKDEELDVNDARKENYGGYFCQNANDSIQKCATYDDNLDIMDRDRKYYKNNVDESPIICPPLKPEDLKVGMVFKMRNDDIYYKIYSIIHAIDNSYCTYRKIYNGYIQSMQCSGLEFICTFEPIDKVPPKIIEVEEEVPVWIEKYHYDNLLNNGEILDKKVTLSTNVCYEICTKNYIELCKIKRKIKKELEFNWESGQYE